MCVGVHYGMDVCDEMKIVPRAWSSLSRRSCSPELRVWGCSHALEVALPQCLSGTGAVLECQSYPEGKSAAEYLHSMGVGPGQSLA